MPEPQKKLSVLQLGTTDTKGGAATVSWSLKKGLEARGHKVNIIVGYKRSHAPSVREIWDTPANNLISKIIKRNFRARLHHHLSYWLSNDIALLPGRRIMKLPEFKNADLIHAHNLHSLFFNLKALPSLTQRKPFIWTLHDMWPLLGQGAHAFSCTHWMTGGCDCKLPDSLPPLQRNNSRHLWKLRKRIYEQSRFTLVVPSLWLQSQVEKSLLKNKPLHVIYNGIDTNRYKPGNKDELRKKYGLPLNKEIILFSSKGGAKNVWKGWEYAEKLIHAYAQREDILFVCRGGCDRMAPQNLDVTYVPFSSDSRTIADYYALSDLLLYPSLADNCPLTVLEALSSGLPALSFHTGGIPELVVHKKHGYIAAYKDLPDLINGFEWLINLPREKQGELSRSCRVRALEKFSLDQMTDNYLSLYYRIIEEFKSNPKVRGNRNEKRLGGFAGTVPPMLSGESKTESRAAVPTLAGLTASFHAVTPSVLTNKQFWNSYYGKFKPHTVEKVYFADLFEKYLVPDPRKSVLEIGCAGGDFLCFLTKKYQYQAYGIDYSDEIETTRALFAYNNLPSPNLYKKDLFLWNPKRQFDVVCSFGFVEHFSNFNEVVQKHVNLIAPGGALIMSMPHFARLQYFFHFILDRENLKKHNTKIMNLRAIKKTLLHCHPEPSQRVDIQYLNYYRTFGFWTERKDFTWWERVIYWKIQTFGRIINKLIGPNHPNPLFSPHLVLIAKKNN